MTFADWWKALPREMKKGDKKRAESRWNKIQAEGHGAQLGEAFALYCADQKRNPWRGWMYGTTFLGRWSEMLEEREEAVADECERELGLHLCDVCRPEHRWRETGDWVNFAGQWILACPEAQEAMRRAIAKTT